jgi:hypothetical protein
VIRLTIYTSRFFYEYSTVQYTLLVIVAWPTQGHIIATNKCTQATHVNRVSGVFRVSALCSVLHVVIKLSLVFTLPAVHSVFDGSLAQFHLHTSYSLTWCAYGSRRCFHGYGYTGACNSFGTRIVNVECVKDLRARHLPSTDAVIARRRSRTTKDRIAYALRRAVEGELGKEGKKESVSDGLKVSHLRVTH